MEKVEHSVQATGADGLKLAMALTGKLEGSTWIRHRSIPPTSRVACPTFAVAAIPTKLM